MEQQDAKGAFIEKLLFALLPLIIAGVGYFTQRSKHTESSSNNFRKAK